MLHAAHLLRYERLFAARANRASLEERRMGLVTDLAAAVARIAVLEAALSVGGAIKRPAIVLSRRPFNTVPAGTSIETMDTYTMPGGLFAADGDAVALRWGFQQTAANNSMITIESPTGVGLLADTRATICDRSALILYERISATKLRRQLFYFYGTGVMYNPAVTTDLADATIATAHRCRLTNSVAAGDCRLISREVLYYPATES